MELPLVVALLSVRSDNPVYPANDRNVSGPPSKGFVPAFLLDNPRLARSKSLLFEGSSGLVEAPL